MDYEAGYFSFFVSGPFAELAKELTAAMAGEIASKSS